MKCDCDRCKWNKRGEVRYLPDGTPTCDGDLKTYVSMYGPLPQKWLPLRNTPLKKGRAK